MFNLKTKIDQLASMQGFMRYFKNTSWLMGERILRMAVGLFVGIWVARYLGPEQFGLFSYAQSFVGLFVAIAGLGLDSIVIREMVKEPCKQAALLGTAFRLKLVGAIVVLTILAIAVQLSQQDDLVRLMIFIIASSTVFQSFNVIDLFFQANVLSKYVVYSNIISLLVSSFIKVILIVNEAPLIAFAMVILFDSLILMTGFVYFFNRHSTLVFSKLPFQKELAINLLKDSWPLILSGLVISIYMKIDQIMIKEMLNAEAVGHYAAAVKISEAWYFIPMVIASSLFPAIVEAKKYSKELYYGRLQKLYDLMVWLAIAIALPMTFLSDWVVRLLYGEQYSQSGSVLMVHIWAGVFVFLGVAFSKYLTNENLTIKSFFRTFLGAIMNVALNLLLIPEYGIKGAAIATLCSQFSANYLYDFFDRNLYRQLKMKTKSFLPIHYLFKASP
ncbi:flippase [Cycloclasticus zancles]|uniref:Membrane protein involved in the export of O-antigen and teichoic acid n=1 Tax=Cycloclasticus zancles 78-ME TaxID=1198232 RepID=S5TAE2_9GAMM|nr:flippase [Cycloclasticus zancles]AGS40574.1 Membrane protein involved in the export of O-antigen and teichoic acid [Cycloclasticus zancles 78-ME]